MFQLQKWGVSQEYPLQVYRLPQGNFFLNARDAT